MSVGGGVVLQCCLTGARAMSLTLSWLRPRRTQPASESDGGELAGPSSVSDEASEYKSASQYEEAMLSILN